MSSQPRLSSPSVRHVAVPRFRVPLGSSRSPQRSTHKTPHRAASLNSLSSAHPGKSAAAHPDSELQRVRQRLDRWSSSRRRKSATVPHPPRTGVPRTSLSRRSASGSSSSLPSAASSSSSSSVGTAPTATSALRTSATYSHLYHHRHPHHVLVDPLHSNQRRRASASLGGYVLSGQRVQDASSSDESSEEDSEEMEDDDDGDDEEETEPLSASTSRTEASLPSPRGLDRVTRPRGRVTAARSKDAPRGPSLASAANGWSTSLRSSSAGSRSNSRAGRMQSFSAKAKSAGHSKRASDPAGLSSQVDHLRRSGSAPLRKPVSPQRQRLMGLLAPAKPPSSTRTPVLPLISTPPPAPAELSDPDSGSSLHDSWEYAASISDSGSASDSMDFDSEGSEAELELADIRREAAAIARAQEAAPPSPKHEPKKPAVPLLTPQRQAAASFFDVPIPPTAADTKPPATATTEPEAEGATGPTLKRPELRLQPSEFASRKSTVFFSYPSYVGKVRRPQKSLRLPDGDKAEGSVPETLTTVVAMDEDKPNKVLRFAVCDNTARYNCVVNTLKRNGFEELDVTTCSPKDSERWNVRWGKYLHPDAYSQLLWFQKVNHFPGSWMLGKKDRLARSVANLRRFHRSNGNALKFDLEIVPPTYHLPAERSLLECKMQMESSKSSLWIVKPPASSCGRGIRVVSGIDEVPMHKKYVVSRYIKNPLLIGGLKFDLRLYVLVTCFNPLRVYLYDEGLARFATSKYSTSRASLKRSYVHLTNYSVNRHSKNFVRNKSAADSNVGSKWSLAALRKYFSENGIDSTTVFERIHDLVIKTLISVEPTITSHTIQLGMKRSSAFEVYGFDVLIDDALKPWLLEVNVSPSFSSSSPWDKFIKNQLMADVFHLIGLRPVDAAKCKTHAQLVQRRSTVSKLLERVSRDRDKVASAGAPQPGKPARSGSSASRKLASLKRMNVASFDRRGRKTQRPGTISTGTLTSRDVNILREFAEELSRLGHFRCIFPTPDNHQVYQDLFEVKRYGNLLLSKWLSMPPERRLAVVAHDPDLDGPWVAPTGKKTKKRKKRKAKKKRSKKKTLTKRGSKKSGTSSKKKKGKKTTPKKTKRRKPKPKVQLMDEDDGEEEDEEEEEELVEEVDDEDEDEDEEGEGEVGM